jgi:hypothetical protein
MIYDTNTAQVGEIRKNILLFVNNRDWDGLKNFTSSPVYMRVFQKHILLQWQEKMVIKFLCGDFANALTAKWTINEVAYEEPGKKKVHYWPKRIPAEDSLSPTLFKAYTENKHLIEEKIKADSLFTQQQKDILLLQTSYYNLYAAVDKREIIKEFDKQYDLFIRTYPRDTFYEKARFRGYSKFLKTGAFFGGGISIGQMLGGNGKLFRTSVGYQIGLDVYTGKLGWYFQYNIANSKNKLDTMYNQVNWTTGTKNFVSDLQAGVGWIALKTDHLRWVIKAGVGSFSFQPVKSDANAALKSIKLKRIPYPSLGTTFDIGSFNNKLTSKHFKAPVGIRLFYHYNFLFLKSKYPAFPGNYHSFGILFGLVG